MLPGILGITGFLGGNPDASYLSFVNSGASGSSYNFNSYDIGEAVANRRIFVVVHWVEGGTHRTLSSVTIGGVAATIHIQQGHTGGTSGFGVAIASALVSSGTLVTINCSFSGSASGCAISAIYAINYSRSTPLDTDFDENVGSSTDLSTTIDVAANGLVIGAYSSSTLGVAAITWGGLTQEYQNAGDIRRSMAWDKGMASELARSITITKLLQADSGNALVVVSWV